MYKENIFNQFADFFTSTRGSDLRKKDEIVISLKDVDTVYEGERFSALYDVNLDIHRGEYVFIVGPNGSGKTTLLETILGLLKVKVGQIKVFNSPLKKARNEICRKIGYVLQNFEIDPNLPFILKDIAMIGRVAIHGAGRPPKAQDWAAVKLCLKLLDLETLIERPIGKLSGGQQQKALIAQALCKYPEILLLDEPFSNLDLDAQDEMFKLLKFMKELGVTILIVSHAMQIPSEADRIIMINKGHIIVNDTPENAFQNSLFEKYMLMEKAVENCNRIKIGV